MSVSRLVAFCALGLFTTFLNAQDWPTKLVKFVSPYPPGGSVDPLARLFGAKLSESLKQQFIVENRTGASGVIGTDYVAKSAPDGYTFVFIFDTHAVHQALNPKLPFDPVKDFAPVMIVGTAPMTISTGAAKPYKSFGDVLKAARAKPDSVTIGNVGNGSLGHLASILISQAAGVKLVPVPYKGGGPLHVDALGGQIDLAIASVAAQAAHVKGGKLRALSITSAQRSPLLPDVPTLDELGIKDANVYSWQAVAGPKGLPADVKTKLHAAIRDALNDPAVKPKLLEVGFEIVASTPEQFAAFQAAEFARWQKLIQSRNIKAD